MSKKANKGLRLKILSKYNTISEFCDDIGVSRTLLYGMISGDKKAESLKEKIKNKLEISDEEFAECMSEIYEKKSQGLKRNKLKLKIKGTFGTISDFCKISGISPVTISYICSCERDGTYDTWITIKDVLNIPDEEMWSYIVKEQF